MAEPRIQVIDSHTGGEPTRVVIHGVPTLGPGSAADQLRVLRREHDWLRTALVTEPRGCDVMVGAVLVTPADSTCVAGVIFFNNVGYLGMCGHGMIGVVTTLAYLQRIEPGQYGIETPVGRVTVTLHADSRVSFENVPCFRYRKDVSLKIPAREENVVGDIAWGGNWFFLAEGLTGRLELTNLPALTTWTRQIRRALHDQGITGKDGAEIDHIELIGPPSDPAKADARSFVLCPGLAYDRSPCGTGTSAKLACLAADGKLAPGQCWRQESILGSVFEASYRMDGDQVVPTVTGRAFVNAEWTLVFAPDDPFAFGISGAEQ